MHQNINYDYDTSVNYSDDPSSTSGTRLGISRRRSEIILNGNIDNTVGGNIVVRLNGTPTRTITPNTVKSWDNGIALVPDHIYKVLIEHVSGYQNYTPSVSVYKVGENTTVGSLVVLDSNNIVRYFTATESLYNICLYVSRGNEFNDAKYIISIEDITEKQSNNEYVSLIKSVDQKVNNVGNYIDYGYDNKITILDSTSMIGSGTTLGVFRDGTKFLLNNSIQQTKAIRLRVSNSLERNYGTIPSGWTNGNLQLKPYSRYKFVLRKISGTCTLGENEYIPSLTAYTGGVSSTIGDFHREEDTSILEFVSPESMVTLTVYIAPTAILTNFLCDIQLIEIDEIDINYYYIAEMDDTISKVRNSIVEPALVFPWVTDVHRYSSNANKQNFEQMIKNIRYLSEKVPCDFILNTGDLTDGDTSKNTTFTRAYECLKDFMNVGLPYVWAQGNHDNNPYNGSSNVFSLKECYKSYFTLTRSYVNMAENGTDYYVDFDELNTRLIVLNANNCTDYTKYAYGDSTGNWFNSILDSNKKIILSVHQTPYQTHTYDDATSTHGSLDIKNVINDFISNGGNVIVLSGHSHLDMAFIDPWLEIMQDCQRFSDVAEDLINPESSPTGAYIDVVRKNARIVETASEDLWTVCVYKPLNNDLDLIRFGAGKDRYFHATPIIPTTVTTKLGNNVVWSSSNELIATVNNGVITGVSSGKCAILAKDEIGNYECWIVVVE